MLVIMLVWKKLTQRSLSILKNSLELLKRNICDVNRESMKRNRIKPISPKINKQTKSVPLVIVSRVFLQDQNPILAKVARIVDIQVMIWRIVGGSENWNAINVDISDISRRIVRSIKVKTLKGKVKRSMRKMSWRKRKRLTSLKNLILLKKKLFSNDFSCV